MLGDHRTKAKPNVVLKFDMTKAHDRLSWLFMTKVMRKKGFCERFIGVIFGIVSNNWYSILINGQPYGFIKSIRESRKVIHCHIHYSY